MWFSGISNGGISVIQTVISSHVKVKVKARSSLINFPNLMSSPLRTFAGWRIAHTLLRLGTLNSNQSEMPRVTRLVARRPLPTLAVASAVHADFAFAKHHC